MNCSIAAGVNVNIPFLNSIFIHCIIRHFYAYEETDAKERPEQSTRREEVSEKNELMGSSGSTQSPLEAPVHEPLMKAAVTTDGKSEDKETDEADGIPQGLQLIQAPSGPRVPTASLSLQVPHDVDTQKLASLGDTMKQNGVSNKLYNADEITIF